MTSPPDREDAWVNHATSPHSRATPFLPGEDSIPLVTWAYPFYGGYYFALALPIFLARSPRDLFRIQLAVVIAASLAFAIYLAYPMSYPRPIISGNSPFDALLRAEYSVDEPGCTFPSLHVTFPRIFVLTLRGHSARANQLLAGLAVGIQAVPPVTDFRWTEPKFKPCPPVTEPKFKPCRAAQIQALIDELSSPVVGAVSGRSLWGPARACRRSSGRASR
ncbi:MAG: hypothetical protein HY791_33275 [Deltaproteobacteria bacterium]|nr:hypothetical protein [Deltaproteobacteria bacterium]